MNELNLSLNFDPQKPWPEILPCFSWKNWKLCGFLSTQPVIGLDEHSFEKAFHSCHPHISLSELARLYQNIKNQNSLYSEINWVHFFKPYRLKDDQNLHKLLLQLANSPISFQNWVDSKNLSQGDLAILRSFKSFSEKPSSERSTNFFFSVCKKISQTQPTRSQGVKILNLAGELILINTQATHNHSLGEEELSTPSNESIPYLKGADSQQWYESLYQLRFPNTYKKDQSQQEKCNQLPWPKSTQARWVREGDTSGIKVSFIAESQKDFETKIEGLKHIQATVQKKSSSLWK